MRLKRSLPVAGGRESSMELGSPPHILQYHDRTGRPIRNSAGRKKSSPGYVDSAVIDEGDDMETCSEDDEGNPIQPRRLTKRKRTPSPEPPPLDPIIYDEAPDPVSDAEASAVFHSNASAKPITLQFNIPLGFHGPLVVKLDCSLPDTPKGMIHTIRGKAKKRRIEGSDSSSQETASGEGLIGFLALAPELRNKIYRLLFVAEKEFNFAKPSNFCRSTAFLRSCRQVHNEGCSILYGENVFSFDRNRTTRAPFWEAVPKEIGYKDVRQFLNMIGSENLRLLREVQIFFEDATPASTPYLFTHEQRRYLNDDHLIDCLRILRNAPLRKLTMGFLGRRTLVKTDVKFLGYLEQIQADEVGTKDYPRWYFSNKIHPDVRDVLLKKMTRSEKLYNKQE